MMKSIKITTVGNFKVGKTCLLLAYVNDCFPTEYLPTSAFDNYVKDITYKGKEYNVNVQEVPGQDYYDEYRHLGYHKTDVFFVCFDISQPSTFDDIERKWLPELSRQKPRTPKIIVGCKADLLSSEDTSTHLNIRDKVEAVVRKWQEYDPSIIEYKQTSSLTREGLSTCFDCGVAEAVNYRFKGRVRRIRNILSCCEKS